MPFTDHNSPRIVATIEQEVEHTRDYLRRLHHIVEQGNIGGDPPLKLITQLGYHASQLSRLIQQFTVRHDAFLESGDFSYSNYENIINFVSNTVVLEPSLRLTEVIHKGRESEEDIYRSLGFSKHEYEDLLRWKEAWQTSHLNMAKAFDFFVSDVVEDLQAGRYQGKLENAIYGTVGLIGIAVDVTTFASSGAVPMLVSSCTTGIAAICMHFPKIYEKIRSEGN